MEITQQEALDCLASHDLIGIGMEADAVRRAMHPENVVTYAVPRTVTFDPSREDLFASIAEYDGDTSICIAAPPEHTFVQIEEALTAVRQRFPSLRLQAFCSGEILALARSSGLSLHEAVTRLRSAGLDSISGADLCPVAIDTLPSASPPFLALRDWIEVHTVAHQTGITSTAGLVFGLGESVEDRVRHLFAIRDAQRDTSGFNAFTLISPKHGTVTLQEPTTAVEYLRTLAVARIVLDNISNIESSCLEQGLKVTQMALRFGANDAGSLLAPEAKPKASFTEEDLRRVIRDAGFMPVERDPLYRTLFLNN